MKINHNIYADLRAKGEYLHLFMQFSATIAGHQVKKNLNTPFKILREDWNQQRRMVDPQTEQGIQVRDRLLKLTDFLVRLNLDTIDEYVSAAKNFLSVPHSERPMPSRFRDFIQLFIDNNKGKYSQNTISRYNSLQANIKAFADTGLGDVFSSMSQDAQGGWFSGYVTFLIERKYHNPSIKQDFKLISSVRNAFQNTGIVVDLDRFTMHLKDGDTKGAFITKDELKVIQNIHTDDSAERLSIDLFLFMCLTGLRIGEVRTLKPSSVSVSGIVILEYTSEKTGTSNRVPLSSLAQKIVARYSNESFTIGLFPRFEGVMSVLRSVLKLIPDFQRTETKVRYRGSERIETQVTRWEQITLHSARHTYSYLMSAGGMSIDEVGKLLNHSSSDTTRKHYEHVNGEARMIKALEILEGI